VKLFVLAKSHRARGKAWCVACGQQKARTAKVAVVWGQAPPVEIDVCSGCASTIHLNAVKGRTARD
jgi:hypothetical protein